VIHQVGLGGDFLTNKPTLEHFRELWQPTLFSRQVDATGSKRLGQRLKEKTVAIIEEHQPEPLPDNVQEEIDYILRSG
jgi:trimethylamine--corrinoid protein Co-methyltransferase